MATASETYWTGISVNDQDIERAYGYVLERGEAVTTRELTQTVIGARVKEEEERRARLSTNATLYQPKNRYEVGQRLLFTALDNREGVVTALRTADNPRLAAFDVVTVAFTEDGSSREFAAGYELEHPLNESKPAASGVADQAPEEIYARYGQSVESALTARLHTDKEFVEQNGKWLLRGLLVEIHVGLLNVAEAAIEQNNSALTTAELARILDLNTEGAKPENVHFALEYALQNDGRFVDIGPSGQARWFLSRLEPQEAQITPRILKLLHSTRTATALPPELETLLNELEDEADVDNGEASPETSPSDVVDIVLTYPHRRAGSLPLTAGVRGLFPESDKSRMLVTLVDEETSARLPVWLVRDGSYLAGLKGWYDHHKLNPGAFVQLERRAESFSATLRYMPQRERGLWVRAARAQGGRLIFGTDRRPVSHKYDEDMLILIGDQAGLDNLTESNYSERSLEQLLHDVFPELAKLVPGGRVHAKTLYSAVNFARRVGPRAVFDALARGDAFSSVGGGYFILDSARVMAR